jgi:hypothetical protein
VPNRTAERKPADGLAVTAAANMSDTQFAPELGCRI